MPFFSKLGSLLSRAVRPLWTATRDAVAFVWEHAIEPGVMWVADRLGLREQAETAVGRVKHFARRITGVLETEVVTLLERAAERAGAWVEQWLAARHPQWLAVLDAVLVALDGVLAPRTSATVHHTQTGPANRRSHEL